MALAGSIAAGIVGVGSMTQFSKYVERSSKDGKMRRSAPEIELGQQHQVYQIMSCLVAGVYAIDKPEEGATDFWTKLGYEEFKLGYKESNLEEQHFPTAELAVLGTPNNARLMLFRRRYGDGANCKELSQPLANDPKSQMRMPKYVVAIRGTIIKNRDDQYANILNLFERLHTHEQYFKSVESLILRMVAISSVEDVWVAGHSLGAAIALTATRKLALEGKLLETHLFHLPNVTVDVVAKKIMKSIAYGCGDTIGAAIPGTDSKCIRKVATPVARKAEKWYNSFAKKTGRLLAPTYSKDMDEECDKLLQVKWTPHLYVNPKDPICSEFITHFTSEYYDQLTASSRPSSSTLSSTLLQGSRSNHLIPAAILYINNWGEGFPEPHRLHQWYKYKDVKIEGPKLLYPKAKTDSEGEISVTLKIRVTTKFNFLGFWFNRRIFQPA